MQRSSPFSRFRATMVAMAAAFGALTRPPTLDDLRIAGIPEYRSRGKGEGRSNRQPRGAFAAAKRAAVKARNVKRHRRAVRRSRA